jgi:hypothetical protein
LHTRNLREAVKRLNKLNEFDQLERNLKRLGVVAKLDALPQQISQLRVQPEGEKSLAPWIANGQRRGFAAELDDFMSRIPAESPQTKKCGGRKKTIWRTSSQN